MQCPRPGLEPRLLDLEASALTMRPLHLPHTVLMGTGELNTGTGSNHVMDKYPIKEGVKHNTPRNFMLQEAPAMSSLGLV